MDQKNFLYPLRLRCMPKAAIWGGRRLTAYGKTSTAENIAETWELACRDKENAVIENGPLSGMPLRDYFATYGRGPLGKAVKDSSFPLLIKLIDARENLSVQVHPDDGYAARVENDKGKTEMWHILEAAPGASIIYGLADGKSADDFRRAVAEGNFAPLLRQVSVKPGDTFFIPSGMVHAIGAGVLLAEIQQNSDLTYRVYDYDRRDATGKTRPLHLEKAMDVIRPFTKEEVENIRFSGAGEKSPGLLADCPYFRVRLLSGAQTEGETLYVTEERFAHLLCVAGGATLTSRGEEYPLRKGDSLLLPAGLGGCTLVLEKEGKVLLSQPH